TQQTERTNKATVSALKSMGQFASTSVGLSSVESVLNQIADRMNSIRNAAREAAEELTAELGNLETLAAMEGNLGQPGRSLRGQLALRTQTLQTPYEAEQMTLAAKASGFGAIQAGRISEVEFQKPLGAQGQLQVMTPGESAATFGKMAGLLP